MSEMGVRVPQRLDDAERILIFSMDEFIGFIITFGTGLALGNALLALGASLGVLFDFASSKQALAWVADFAGCSGTALAITFA